ncbi:uncharacterized protein KGF55_003430 [Candida pseudojiufengensis]|uniref:uncharacterized protein n=1 Tax=Candida pseudojiufengensis TaxID=497109 RepID=UPI0022246733|nr:uncharacterized protein KGF55_003430 [Candida pseudojiufengensis]KAI5962354.1 hypothetical protein KGF55_003430 [Candida pseudojiufengensis]
MVAEPVQATVQTLNRLITQTNDFINTQQEKLQHSEIYEKLFNADNPISIIPQQAPKPKSNTTSLFDKILHRISERKVTYGTILAIGLGITCYKLHTIYLKSSQPDKFKKRVPKLSNGARNDTILIIGSPTEPITRLIALDLEKRGFIVYLTILDNIDLKYIESNKLSDEVNYIDLTKTSIENSISQFNQLLKTPVIPFERAEPHYLKLRSVIFAPSLYFPIGPIENIGINTWQKLNERLLTYLKLFSSGLIQLIRNQHSNLLLINSTNTSSLNVPYHAPETMLQNQLSNLFTTLTYELKQFGINVTQLKLGNISLSNQKINSNTRIESLINSEIRAWTSEMKQFYGSNFSKNMFKSNKIKGIGGKGTSIKGLYHLIFELIYGKHNPNVVYYGKGARLYNILSYLVPISWLSWYFN